jgi:hypothetical protein
MGKHLEEEKKSIFKKFLIIYVIILTVVMLVFLGYVADSLIKYEKNQIENYMEDVISDLKKASKKGKIERYVDTSKITMSQFEKENTSINEGFSELLDTKKITYKLNHSNKRYIKMNFAIQFKVKLYTILIFY